MGGAARQQLRFGLVGTGKSSCGAEQTRNQDDQSINQFDCSNCQRTKLANDCRRQTTTTERREHNCGDCSRSSTQTTTKKKKKKRKKTKTQKREKNRRDLVHSSMAVAIK